jgi:hypothetical protein
MSPARLVVLERLSLRGRGIVGSNPAAPTNAAKEFPKAAKSRKTPVPHQCPGRGWGMVGRGWLWSG